MTYIRIFIFIICLMLLLTSFSKASDIKGIDIALTNNFKTMIAAEQKLRYDSLAPAFKKQMIAQLENPITFKDKFDSLSQFINIKTSADNQIKFYSWDEIGGGTWHNINCLAQFKSENGSIIVKKINIDCDIDSVDFTDSGIYEVNDFYINGSKYYLTFAWGTHGGGYQHIIAQIFSISSDELVKCSKCFADNKDLIIEYPRVGKTNLTFDAKTNTITYNDFSYDEDGGISTPNVRIITLELVNGVFIPK